MNTQTTISESDVYQVGLHIYNAFQVAIDKRGANFRGTQSLYMSQIQALQFLAMGKPLLFKKLDRLYYSIDRYTPPAYSVLFESDLNMNTADSRRSPILSAVQG